MKSLAKFHADKTYKYFPGVAIIHFISNPRIKYLLSKMSKEMKDSTLFNKYVFLPEESYHSTISDLLTYNDLSTNPTFKSFPLKEESKFSVIDKFVLQQMQNSTFNLNINMRISEITDRKVRIEPKTEEDKRKLDKFRFKVANGINIPFDDSYQFHISLTYQLFHRTESEKNQIGNFLNNLNEKYLNSFGSFNIDIVDLVIFDSMKEFKNITMVRETESA
jgi:hypothetical protein